MRPPVPLPSQKKKRGFTLIEITLVISILLGMIAVLFIGTRAYLKGADRAICLQHLSAMQKAVRSFGNINGLVPGTYVPNLMDELIGPDRFIPVLPMCPDGGLYTFAGNTLPQVGDLYLSCSQIGHVPKNHVSW